MNSTIRMPLRSPRPPTRGNRLSFLTTWLGIPPAVVESLRKGHEYFAVRLAIANGQRDVNTLTNMVFFSRHPERQGKKLVQGEPGFDRLAREWIDIRDKIVRPLLSKTGQTPLTKGNPPPSFPSRSLAILKKKIEDDINRGQITPGFGKQVLEQAQSMVLRPLPKILSGWGWRKGRKGTYIHQGLDLAAPMHTRITAVRKGRVAKAGNDLKGFGNYIVLDHGRDADGNRHYTIYGHNDRLMFQSQDVGKVVEQGQLIALSGNTGLSEGPHLHYEVRVIPPNGPGPRQMGFFIWQTSVDPNDYIWPKQLTLD